MFYSRLLLLEMVTADERHTSRSIIDIAVDSLWIIAYTFCSARVALFAAQRTNIFFFCISFLCFYTLKFIAACSIKRPTNYEGPALDAQGWAVEKNVSAQNQLERQFYGWVQCLALPLLLLLVNREYYMQ